jgi:hypothetical protein
MARRRIAGSAIPDDGTSVDQWLRRVKPQMGHVATPVVGSTSRKLGQPLVPQKMRPPVLAAELRRRMRRMELARPAKVVVVERVIMVKVTLVLSGAPQAIFVPGPRPMYLLLRSGQPEMGAGAVW